jgi:hypothetical protein
METEEKQIMKEEWTCFTEETISEDYGAME